MYFRYREKYSNKSWQYEESNCKSAEHFLDYTFGEWDYHYDCEGTDNPSREWIEAYITSLQKQLQQEIDKYTKQIDKLFYLLNN